MGSTQVVINALDSIDTTMTTIIILMITTFFMYRMMKFFNKPLVFGGVFAGVIISWLNLPKQYFDISSCATMGDIGVNFYLMILGSRFNYLLLKKRRGSLTVSIISAIVPFICGMITGPFIYHYNVLAPINEFEFSLVVGLCMSIASLSLISLFLNQTNLISKSIGHVGLMAAGIDDLLFWIVYGGLLLALQKDEIIRYNLFWTFSIYVISMTYIFPRLIRYITSHIKSTVATLAFILCGCLISCVIADSANIHQVFGAFVFGLMLPRKNKLITEVCKNLEEFITVFFLPIFFAQVGILAKINIIDNTNLLLMGLIISLIAFASKFFAVYIPNSYIYKHPEGESAFLASLLNIRGVTEIIMMRVFHEIGFISTQIFTIFVVSAMVTTWCATSLVFYFRKYIN